MRFEPKSEADIASENLLPVGVYPFEIVAASDEISKTSGNEMVKLTLHVFRDDGAYQVVFDYLLPTVAYKLRHCAEVCGLMSEYDAGMLLAEHFIGKTGYAKVSIQKDKSGQFPDRNGIADYVPKHATAPHAAPPARARQVAPAGGGDLDDEVPF